MIKDVPPYDGNPAGLHSFLEQMNEFIQMSMPEATVYAETITRAIRNRVIDKASDALNLYGTANNWPNIKRDLTAHFADKRDESTMIQELHSISQGGDKAEDYFAKISNILSSLKNWANINEPLTCVQKHQWYDKMALNVFINKLREPMGSHVRSMRPETLPDARSICIKEQSLAGLRYQQRTYPTNKPPIPARNYNFNTSPNRVPAYYPQQNRFQGAPVQFNNNAPRPQAYNRPMNPYYNHKPFTTPKQILDKPTPMDTTSHINKYRQPTYGSKPAFQHRFNTQGQPRVHVEELYHNEQYCDNEDNQQDEYSVDHENHQEEMSNIETENESPIIEIEEDLDFRSNTLQTRVT